MQALTFLIRLVDPLLATQPQSGEPNSAVTYPFIPGSTIRGALIARYLGGEAVDAADETFQRLFLNGKVRYLNAYPAHPARRSRMLPKPLSWNVPKDEAENPNAEINDFAVELPTTDEPHKPPGSGDFCYPTEEGKVQVGGPAIRVTVHNASDDRDRKQEGQSQVFRYDALATGEEFIGVVIAEEGEAPKNDIQALLKAGELMLGGSRSGGYGRATIDLESVDVDTDWQEYSPLGIKTEPLDFDEPEPEDEWGFSSAGPERDFVILTCLSDVILPESGEQPEEWLEKLAGQRPVKSFRQIRLVGGFNHKWGLPLPQRWALAMGSVFVFPVSCKPTLEKLAEHGIGERKAEGFGRLAVDWHTEKTLMQRELPRREIGGSAPRKLSPDGKALAQCMANRRLQAELDRWLVRTVNDLTQGKDAFRDLPSATQLSRARLAARRAWMQGNLREFTQHCRNMSKLTQREWDPARLKGDKLGKWIVKQMQARNAIKLDFEVPVVAGVQAQLTRELRHRTVARLIEGVLRRAVRVAKQKEKEGNHD